MSGFSGRLRLERERLGYSQRKLATELGITQQTQFKYEKAQSVPNLDYLDAVRKLGFNVLFILGYENASLIQDAPLNKEEFVDISVNAYKDVELSNLDADGFPVSLGVRMREFRRTLEDKTANL